MQKNIVNILEQLKDERNIVKWEEKLMDHLEKNLVIQT
jgi:hypothetical protein